MKNNFISIDPGELGVMTIWEDIKPIKCIKYNERVVDNEKPKRQWEVISHREEYKDAFEKYKGCEVAFEWIVTVYDGGGAFAGFVLAKAIGDVKGMAFRLCEVIEKKNTPNEWKARIDKDYLVKPKGVKWEKGEKKKRSITICEELFPDIDLRTGEIVEHKKQGYIEEIKDDNMADSILIGASWLVYKGIAKVVIENGKHKLVKV